MVAFLSAEWLARLDAVGRRCPTAGVAGLPVVIAHRVTGTPRGDVTYHLRVDETGVRVSPGAPDDADLTFVSDRDTAVGIATGTCHAQRELTAGRLRARGSASALAPCAEALAAFEQACGPVRAETEFDTGA